MLFSIWIKINQLVKVFFIFNLQSLGLLRDFRIDNHWGFKVKSLKLILIEFNCAFLMNCLNCITHKRAKFKCVKIFMKRIILWFQKPNKYYLLILHDDLLEQITTDCSLKISHIYSSFNELIHQVSKTEQRIIIIIFDQSCLIELIDCLLKMNCVSLHLDWFLTKVSFTIHDLLSKLLVNSKEIDQRYSWAIMIWVN